MTADIGNADKKARVAMMIELTMLTHRQSFMTIDIGNSDTNARVAKMIKLTMLTQRPELS